MAKKTTVSSVARKRRERERRAASDVHVITPDASSADETGAAAEHEHAQAVDAQPQVWLPGMPLGADEQLQPDMSVYVMLQEMQVDWPCLSFDVLQRAGRAESLDFPLEAALVAGTQADRADRNKIMLMRWTNLHKNQEHDSDHDSDNDNDSDSDADEDTRGPQLLVRSISHAEGAGVNRVRALQRDASSLVVASWSERGRVFLWDMSDLYAELYHEDAGDRAPAPQAQPLKRRPLGTAGAHKTEGFALDWSRREWGNLLTGDCAGHIYWTQLDAQAGGSQCNGAAFTGHAASVEDLQWSPAESTVFASASCDQTVRIWDVRCSPRRAALAVHCHDADVNVLAWNAGVDYLLASGGDDGSFKTWDLRTFASQAASAAQSYERTMAVPVAAFHWHKAAVTALEWHPTEASVLAVSGADDQISLWDFSVERDAEQDHGPHGPHGPHEHHGPRDPHDHHDLPPQLLFTHHGQHEVKELHWHRQAPGVLLSTAASGFNIFKTISV